MRLTQASFSSGEISPLLHARTDLARYTTGLAELKNMIVLPQGGVTRRAGLVDIIESREEERSMKLIPFEFNSSDSCLLQFIDKKMKVWIGVSNTPKVIATIDTPYSIADVQGLHYVQSGNVIFLAHQNYKPQKLTRSSLTDWTIEDFPFHGGPFIEGTEWNATAYIELNGTGDNRTLRSRNAGIFSEGLVGTLVKLEYAVPPKTTVITSEPSPLVEMTSPYEVKGTLNIMTTGDWTGLITVQRSADGGESWVTIRQYRRTNYENQGQWDFTVSETDASILYRVTATHDNKGEPISPDYPVWAAEATSTSKEAAEVTITVSGFLKSEIYRITEVATEYNATCTRENSSGYAINDEFNGRVSLWSIGAWGKTQGYPKVVAMYQDRLVFASSQYQPQTIWMSRTGDYADFSVSDPLSDDDAVTITLAGSVADGIHSLLATADLLAFTNAGEWKISGAGDAGAITPSALTAHQQTTIGAKDIQPILVDGKIIFVQTQGRKVFALGYDLNIDGYAGSEISILSEHLFTNKNIIGMAYQKNPDSLLWFVLDDGSFISCTYKPEHEVIGWARHTSWYSLYHLVALAGTQQTEIIAVGGHHVSGWGEVIHLARFMPRDGYSLTDSGLSFESVIRTLRLTLTSEDGSIFTSKKFIPRVIVSAINSSEAWIAPGEMKDAEKNWERRRRITWDEVEYLTDADVQLDTGFSEYACVQLRSIDNKPLTIVAITPILTG